MDWYFGYVSESEFRYHRVICLFMGTRKKKLSETSCSVHKDSSLTTHPRFMRMEPEQNKGRLT